MSNTPSGRVADDDGVESAITPVEVERTWRDKTERAAGRCIVVTGMHRSGTSAIAGALCDAGAWAGPEAELIPGVLDTSRGHYERRTAAQALEAELVNLGGSWSNPPLDQLQPWAMEQIRPTLRRVLAAATTDTPRGAVPLIKDPRLCLFAAELRTLLLDSWSVVLAVRHPLEVARSLHDRDGLSIQAGLALWEIYNHSICAGLAGRPVHVVRYDALIDEPDETAVRLVDQVLASDEPLPRSAQDRAAAHLSREARHHRADVTDEDRWLSVASLRLWHQLEAASQSPEPIALPEVELSYSAAQYVRLDATRRGLEIQVQEQADELAGQAGLLTEVEELRAANEELTVEVAALKASAVEAAASEGLAARIEELTIANQGLTQLVQSMRDLRANALNGWADSDRQREGLIAARDELDQRYQRDVRRLLVELDAARGEVAAARAAHEEARDGAEAASAAALGLAQALQEVSDELVRVDAHRQEVIEYINAICSSESWRIGHALTWPARVFRRSGRREGRSTDPS